MWTEQQIKYHKKAAELLYKIVTESFGLVSKNRNVTEYSLQKFILGRFNHYGLKTDRDNPIVAFRENTSFVHYFPKSRSKKLKPDSLILIDVWARLKEKNSPFADITWMGYYGKSIPEEINKSFSIVLKARDATVNFVRNNLKKDRIIHGITAHNLSDRILIEHGFTSTHFTGHSIGFRSPHGSFSGLTPQKDEPLKMNIGYTIEPGIYMKNKFGMRSEIDFYISSDKKIKITTAVQKEIVLLK